MTFYINEEQDSPSMMILRRSMDYDGLLNTVRGKKVAVWACNTCARLCNGIGGEESALRLAQKLESDGVEVTGVLKTSASCIMKNVAPKCDDIAIVGCDVVISLTCDVGANCASRIFERDVVNPIETLGPGYIDENGVPLLADGIVVFMNSSPFV